MSLLAIMFPMRRFALLLTIGVGASAFGHEKTPEVISRGDGVISTKRFGEWATPAERVHIVEGFDVELLYSVPRERQGSWVNLCADPQGRIITSDESGDLYRVTVSKTEQGGAPTVERIPIELGAAQGLLHAFGSLYVVVNGDPGKRDNGLYRVRDTDNDDQYDSYELIRKLEGENDHGPHAVVLAPDGKSLYIVCGNNTKLTEIAKSRVPRVWDEDQLLPRLYGVGFMRGVPAPGGAIYRIDPDGKQWELVAIGFRNEYDAAFNADGELFTYDSDMEFDFGTPWYRPTRVCHVISGSDWGWRNGSAKWPVYYADTLPPVVNVGLGSPTGVTFGYNARFPGKYQRALYICDWTYGKIYAVHLSPSGSTYSGTLENFVVATPLPLTDAIINPHDGTMYFSTGGRGVQSGLYRVTYIGPESTEPVDLTSDRQDERAKRRDLENDHLDSVPGAVERAWSKLNDPDRFVRHAARTVLEHQPLENWKSRALNESDPQTALTSLLALVRTIPRSYKPEGIDLDTPPPTFPAIGAQRHPLHAKVIAALARFDGASLPDVQRLELLRVYALALYRLGPPDEATRGRLISELDRMYPAESREENALLTELLCYLQAPSAATNGVQLLAEAKTQEEQLDLARSLRFQRSGWTTATQRALFEWILRAQAYKGGANFQKFIEEIKDESLLGVSENDRASLNDVINGSVPEQVSSLSASPRVIIKEWTTDELLPLFENGLKGRNFDRGREMFAAANCFACHRFVNDGGATGPDLTALAGRFGVRDILASIMDPDQVVSDQYAAVTVVTTDGKVVTGRVVNFGGGAYSINTNMLDPLAVEKCQQSEIEEMSKAKVSMMPRGLLNTLNADEILDLMAFLLSQGDRNHEMFSR
jgi:putative heme-binding domain-containing protein